MIHVYILFLGNTSCFQGRPADQDQQGLEVSQDHKDLKDKEEKVVYQGPMDSEVNPDLRDLLAKPVSVETLDLLDLQVLPDREELRG